jgi:SAM-dependent methyltransferase
MRMSEQGWVDILGPVRVCGWAIDDENPDSPALVDILLSGELLATVPARHFRPDLVTIGRNGRCAFSYILGVNSAGDGSDVEVRFHNSQAQVPTDARAVNNVSGKLGRNDAQMSPGDPNPWNRDVPGSCSSAWVSAKSYSRHLNRQISGDPSVHWLDYALSKYILPQPSDAAILLLGSSEGGMETVLCERGFTGRIVATDIADKALSRAKERAIQRGFNNIVHVQADLNKDHFDDKFDFIIAEGVLHHIERLDECLESLKRSLKSNGLLIGVEYKGPYRFQLPERQVRWINAALGIMPRKLRLLSGDGDQLMPPSLEDQATFHYGPPSAEAMLALDPSEAVSGFRLPTLLKDKFRVIEERQMGGSLVMYLDGHFPFDATEHDAFADEWLKVIISIEDTLNHTGILPFENFFFVAGQRVEVSEHVCGNQAALLP